jgi:uncharacterized iron-regulated membrane protein
MLFVGATGILIQGFSLADEMAKPPVAATVSIPRAEGKPAPRSAMKRWEGWIKHLHSGESFGPVGTAISIASGFALLFFAGSGLWMYLQMWRRRAAGQRRGLFWRR